jgi:hypothetical protein
MLALLLAALVMPASCYLRPQIERFLFAERYVLERGVESPLRALCTIIAAACSCRTSPHGEFET